MVAEPLGAAVLTHTIFETMGIGRANVRQAIVAQ
jgi:hypothetical protein